MLTNLQNAEITGLKIMANHPTTASEFEVAKDIEDIRLLEKDYQDLKNVLLTTTYTVTTPTPIPMPTYLLGYYEGECQIPMDESLIDWLTEYEWANKYERGEWDCSQMTAALEWYLENCGFKTVMKQGTGPSGGGHAWVSIWLRKGTEIETPTGRMKTTKDGYYIYEATSRHFVTDPVKLYGYKANQHFDDIYAVWDYYQNVCLRSGKCGEEAFLDEYGWWE